MSSQLEFLRPPRDMQGGRFASDDQTFGSIRRCSPSRGRSTELRLAPHSGNLTPPSISPSCPHFVKMWLGRGIIIGDKVVARQPATAALRWMGTALHLVRRLLCRLCLHRWSSRILRIAMLVPNVIQSPDMTAHSSFCQRADGIKSPLTYLPVERRFLQTIFCIF